MRKICTLILCLALLAGLSACGLFGAGGGPNLSRAPEDFTEMSEDDLQYYLGLASETMEAYAMALYFSEAGAPEFPLPFIGPQLQAFINTRLENNQSVYIEHESITDVAITMSAWQVIDGKLYCAPTVNVLYRAPGEEFDTGFSAFAQLIIADPRAPMLQDLIDPSF